MGPYNTETGNHYIYNHGAEQSHDSMKGEVCQLHKDKAMAQR